jgi:hypothetical protein
VSDRGISDQLAADIFDETGRGVIVTGYVVITEYVGSDGKTGIHMNAPPDQSIARSVGLVEYGSIALRKALMGTD